MYPKNLILYRFSNAVSDDLQRLSEVAPENALRELGPLETSASGFVSPARGGDLLHQVNGNPLLAIGTDSRLLPTPILNREVDKKVLKLEAAEGRTIGGRERRRLRDQVRDELLPSVLINHSRTFAWMDRGRGFACIDTAGKKSAEEVLKKVREALGSFPAVPLAPTNPVRVLLTSWLAGAELPADFTLGDECELRDPATTTGAVWKGRRATLDSEEVREHLRAGKQVSQLGLCFKARIEFVIDENLVLRKIRFTEVALGDLDNTSAGDAVSELDAQFALFQGEIGELLDALDTIFGLPRPTEGEVVDEAIRRRENGELPFAPSSTDDDLEGAKEDARRALLQGKHVSISGLQRVLRIGYNRAARLIKALEHEGFVTPPDSAGRRQLAGAPAHH
ncbi:MULTISPECIES: recombination-associated protein RdgC [unclassified Dyella]|uniref:recombination-associated protein RdgC n=1 Tax=Dyella sp. ASV21 TaxID=2795114 RepID=UPI001E632BF3|nr:MULTISPECIES: recombination-associated protein RdgC [unclassified Dyella]